MPPSFPNLGNQIGGGVDGSVYALTNENAVVKFSSSFDQLLLAEVATGVYPHFVRVLDFGVLDDGIHFTVMERLNPLTEDEAKVFHTIVSHEDRNASKVFSPEQLDEILDGLAKGLVFDKAMVKAFYQQLVLSAMSHQDLHPRNVMRDASGEFKLVDLNRISKAAK
jgi:serine/threonine protein kinase